MNLDPQGLRYAAAGTQYQHAQQNFQALGGLQQGLQGLGAGGRMGLAGFPNTSTAPQQAQFHAGGLGGAAAGLAAQQQGLRFMAPGVALGGGQLAGQYPAGLNAAAAAQRAQGLGQGLGQSLGQGLGQGLNLGNAAVRGAATPQQAAANLLLQQQQQRQQQQQQQFGAAAAAQQFAAGGLGNLGAGSALQQQLNAAQRQLALQQQQQQQPQNELLALLGKAQGGHGGFTGQLGQLGGLATSPAGAGGAAGGAGGVQASHALFGGRPGGFAGAAAAGLGGPGGGGLGINAAAAASLAAAAAASQGQQGAAGSAGGGGLLGDLAGGGDARAAQQQQQQLSPGGPGLNADEFPALGAAAAAAARGAAAAAQQQQQQQAAAGQAVGQGAPGGARGTGGDYSAAAMALRTGGVGQQEFSIQNDSDFPALGGAAGGGGADSAGQGGAGGDPGAAGQEGKGDGKGAAGEGGTSPLPGGGQLTPGAVAAGMGADRYGLLGLLHVIRMSEPDLTMLALGTDLTGLGLNLNSADSLYKVLVSPLADAPVRPDLDFEVPACYKHNPPRLQPGYLAKFKEETLFYIFYSMPQDEAQLIAADELFARGWWWHKKFRCWFIHAPNNPVVKSAANRSERGTYLFFDTNIWDVVQKSDVEVFFEDVERPPNLPRSSIPGSAPSANLAAAQKAAAAGGGGPPASVGLQK